MKRKLIVLIFVITLMCNIVVPINAKSTNDLVEPYSSLEDYLTEKFEEINEYSWESIKFSPNTKLNYVVTLPLVSTSTFIDYTGYKINEDEVQIKVEDSSIVHAPYYNQLTGVKVGKTNATIRYRNLEQTITIIVKEDMDFDKLMTLQKQKLETEIIKEEITGFNSTRVATNRSTIVEKALAMVNYSWTPTKPVIKYSTSLIYFPANQTVTGIPYTWNQWNGNDEISFASALNKADFYTAPTKSGNYNQCRYGSDCSGFVSICWGIPRETTSSFRQKANSGVFKKYSSYSSLQDGDALVNNGHIILVSSNYPTTTKPYVFVYEQTPYNATYNAYSYSQLSQQGYVGIGLKI